MAYSTISDIQAEFKGVTFSTTSVPTLSTITGTFIPQADAEIDSLVGLRYTTPITGTNALLIMKQCSVWLVADRIRSVLRLKSQDTTNTQALPGGTRKDAIAILDKISKGLQLLSDADLANSTEGLGSYGVSVDTGETLTFDKNSDQW